MNTPAILGLGEPMIEFNQTEPGQRNFLQGFGGDTSNAIIACARQGAPCGYITRLGDDEFGRMLLGLWQAEAVDARGVVLDPAAHTAVYFVTHGAQGHSFSYLRRDSAASRMRADDLPRALIEGARTLHVSGISQAISASACDTVQAAIAIARAAGASCVGVGNTLFSAAALAKRDQKALVEEAKMLLSLLSLVPRRKP